MQYIMRIYGPAVEDEGCHSAVTVELDARDAASARLEARACWARSSGKTERGYSIFDSEGLLVEYHRPRPAEAIPAAWPARTSGLELAVPGNQNA